MEFRNQDKSMGIPSSFRYHNHPPNQDPVMTKRSSRVEEPRREIINNNNTIHGDDTVLSTSPDRNQTPNKHYAAASSTTNSSRSRRDPDPRQHITSQHDPASASASETTSLTRYRECQKNHAAHMGGHVVDGCGEFMPNGDEGTPESMRCAACDCHRNFHRKEISGPTRNRYMMSSSFNANHTNSTPHADPAAIFHPVPFQQAPALFQPSGTMMAFGRGVQAESSSEDLNGQLQQGYGSSSRKRFRTKFTQEQKDKMMEFAEKIGWRMQKQDEDEVQSFCVEAGVKRQVFKVWMHNNRQAIKRKHS